MSFGRPMTDRAEDAFRAAAREVRLRGLKPRSGFRQINAVVHGIPKFLFAAQVALGGLHGDVPEQKLNLLQFPAGEVTQPRATATEVVRSELRNSSAASRSLHHMPYGFRCNVLSPDCAGSADRAKDEAGVYPRGLHPVIHRMFYPSRHRYGSDVLALSNEIRYDPMLLPDLDIAIL